MRLTRWFFFCLAGPPALTAQVNQRGASEGTNEFAVASLRNEPGVAWEARPGFRDFGAMAVSGGVVVSGNITGRGGTFAFDEVTGKQLWSVPGQMKGEPAVDGAAAYVVSDLGSDRFRLSKLALKTGKPLWSAEDTKLGSRNGPPLVHGGRVYLISDNGKVNAYDAATGKPIWEHTYSPGRGSCPSAFAISDGVLYFGGGEEQGSRSNGRFLWALNAATGQELWRFAAKPESYSQGECVKSPAVSNGIVVAAAWNIIYALDAKTGQLKWTQEIRRNVDGRSRRRTLSEPLITGGIVYSYFQEGIAGWDLNSGKPAFGFPGAFPAEQQDNRMAAAGGVLYFTANLEDSRAQTSGIGYLYALDLQTKQLLWKHKVNRPSRFEAVARWATRYFIPSDKALYYENESILVKVK